MISKEQIEHIAKLARIKLKEGEIEKYQKDLSEILEYFGVLQGVDTSAVEPMTHSIALTNVAREDSARPWSAELLQKLVDMFSAAREGFLKVKAIFAR